MDMKEKIKSWGIPEALYNEEVEYHFEEGMETEYGEKFVLKNKKGKELFVMDFLSPSENLIRAFDEESNYLKIQFIYVPDINYRRKGIASFFLDKLVQFAKEINVTEIHLNIAPNQKGIEGYSLENAMNKKQLRKYYEKHLGYAPSIELVFGSEGS